MTFLLRPASLADVAASCERHGLPSVAAILRSAPEPVDYATQLAALDALRHAAGEISHAVDNPRLWEDAETGERNPRRVELEQLLEMVGDVADEIEAAASAWREAVAVDVERAAECDTDTDAESEAA